MSEIPRQEDEIKIEEQIPEIESQLPAEMPGDFEDPEGKSGKWKTVKEEVEIEGKKVEVSYREKVIELPKHRQEETGIQRIRRREVIDMPLLEEFKDHYEKHQFHWKKDEHFKVLLDYLTDHRLLDESVWTHSMYGDLPWRGFIAQKGTENFKKEGLYFQKIFPKASKYPDGVIRVGQGFFVFEEKEGSIQKVDIAAEPEKCLNPERWLMNLSLFEGNFFLGIQPSFSFSNRNSFFVSYIENILDNRDTQEMLKLAGWTDDQPSLENKQGPYYAEREFLKLGYRPEYGNTTTGFFQRPDNTNLLRMFLRGEKIAYPHHPFIPVIGCPKVPELRWCHSEFAIIPTKKSLNVLFFETSKEENLKKEK